MGRLNFGKVISIKDLYCWSCQLCLFPSKFTIVTTPLLSPTTLCMIWAFFTYASVTTCCLGLPHSLYTKCAKTIYAFSTPRFLAGGIPSSIVTRAVSANDGFHVCLV